MIALLPTFQEIADSLRSIESIENGKWYKVSVLIKIEDTAHCISDYCVEEAEKAVPNDRALNMSAYIKANKKGRRRMHD